MRVPLVETVETCVLLATMHAQVVELQIDSSVYTQDSLAALSKVC
jgi:hypothetical protein